MASFFIAHGATLKLLNCSFNFFCLVKLMLGYISGNCYPNSMRTDCLHTNFILLKISTTLCVNFIVYTIPHIIGSLLSPPLIHHWMVLHNIEPQRIFFNITILENIFKNNILFSPSYIIIIYIYMLFS